VIPIESVDHAVGMLLRLGDQAEVLAPTELRERIVETVAALAKIYQVTPS
jgi:predicted DNA-binding transcriptional regulator YafY